MAQTPDEPLTMTVHSLPRLDQAGAQAVASTRSGRWKLLGLMLVCAAPVIASYFTYYVIRPEGRRNYGELIDPQRPLPTWSGTNAQGQQVPLASLKDQWLLISVADSSCPEACQQHLYLQRQLRETLGREKTRLDWVWLRTGDAALAEPLKEATQAAQVLHVDAQALAAWLQPAPGQKIEDHLYVVDPLGNWMMRFPAHLDPAQAKRDLDRLLRASAFWDKEGRQN
ncbi:SCO family protein [Hydrogenophaga sp.]|uniref:SCO family protein n=1 Tax=Hydrogenophaga sp. TaxID=1904254 RepID=UPI003F6FF1DE